jgi:hypothetical protein
MASGFFALLDDIVAIAKVAAASLDDVAAQAFHAGKKTAGIVIDDAAVTPRYVVGFAADRELPIIARIAWGSLRNKLLYLLPAALLLTAFMPWAVTPLLVAGAAFLCFEGYEKAHALIFGPSDAPAALDESAPPNVPASPGPKERAQSHSGATAACAEAGTAPDPGTMARLPSEEEKVASAIRTDFILSAEIMAITLAAIEVPGVWVRALILALVGSLVTIFVYGAVALIVKADDVGLHLAHRGDTPWVRALGGRIVRIMPAVLSCLSLIGMAAMLWVGGGIFLHALEKYGLAAPAHAVHELARLVGALFGPLSGLIAWSVEASIAGLIGLAIGWLTAIGVEQASAAAN